MTSYSSVQRAWEKSATMSQREIALVARGVDPEADLNALSDKGRKRAAMAGCRTSSSEGCGVRLGGELQWPRHGRRRPVHDRRDDAQGAVMLGSSCM